MTQSFEVGTPITASADLWATSILPKGIVEGWLRPNGSRVESGDPVVAVRIEDALHELMAPASGRLSITEKAGAVIEPGSALGTIDRHLPG